MAMNAHYIGPAMKMCRTVAGIKQAEIAAAVNKHPPQISAIEKGKAAPTFKLLEEYAAHLGVRSSDIVRLAERLEGEELDRGKPEDRRVNSRAESLVVKFITWATDKMDEDGNGKAGHLI